MRIYLATWAEDNQGATLTYIGATTRLISYFFLRDLAPNWLIDYVTKGQVEGGGKTNAKNSNQKRR